MTEKNSAPVPSPDENTSNRHLERVVDELRMVLSDLNRTVKNRDLDQPPPPLAQDPSPKPFAENDLPEAGSNAGQPPDPDSAASTPLSSDADFWNGNVLGWPNGLGVKPKGSEEPELKEKLNDPLSALSDLESSHGDAGLTMRDPIDEINMEEAGSPFSPAKLNSMMPSFEGQDTNDIDHWVAEEPAALPSELPSSPMSPLESDLVPPKGPVSKEQPALDPFSPTFIPFVEGANAPPEPSISEPELSPVPIPQTLEKKPDPPKNLEPNLNLESPDLKPKGLVQIACIYPEGQEKLGQTFVNKLREMGEKSKKTLNLQAVFVHPWTSDKMDVAAWKKSALLSGADVMFVLVSKANANSLKLLSADSAGDIKSRTVYLEQISMRALYADILVELQRGK